jgi:hypothetical protein
MGYTCEYRSVPDDEIKMWIEVGVFHELFCSGSNPVMPYLSYCHSYSEDQTRETIKEWSNGYMMPKYFPTGEQIRIDGKFRVGNVKTVATCNLKIGYFIEHATKCILLRTLGLQEFKETERIDTKTLMAVVKQLDNTGTNESWHSRVDHIDGFGTATKANKHMLGLLGMVRVARIKEDNVRISEALGKPPIGYDRWSASIVANRYAEAAGYIIMNLVIILRYYYDDPSSGIHSPISLPAVGWPIHSLSPSTILITTQSHPRSGLLLVAKGVEACERCPEVRGNCTSS